MDKNIITIDTIEMLNKLINDIKNNEHFCDKFKFSNYDYKYIMLKELKINIKSFDEKYYYHSKKSKIHISESEDGSFLISTYGMIIYNKRFNSEKEQKAGESLLFLCFDSARSNLPPEKSYDELSVITVGVVLCRIKY